MKRINWVLTMLGLLLSQGVWAQNEPPRVERDSQKRVVRAETGNDTLEITYDQAGRMRSERSARFGLTEFHYDSETSTGPFARVAAKTHTTDLGQWETVFVYNTEGERIVHIEGPNRGMIGRALKELRPYLWPKGPKPSLNWRMPPAQSRGIATHVREREGRVALQTSNIFGHEIEVELLEDQDGRREISDDRGAARVETWDGSNLVSAFDNHGSLLETTFDSLGRPEKITIGGNLVVQYAFEGTSYYWIEKLVTNEADGKVLGRWRRADDFEEPSKAPIPRSSVRVFGPGSLPLAEWDELAYPDGVALVMASGGPYALVPLKNDEALWRSISTTYEGLDTRERVDYTDSKVRVILSLGPASLAGGAETTIVVERNRRPSALELGGGQ